ncbi:MAG: TRAP transporter large permease [Firmicutes bacterium]|nr:TRAP transporter large permease [Bacillota bacterium]
MLTFAIFGGLVALVMLGVPVAVAMAMTAVLSFVLLGEPHILPMLAQRMYSATTGFTLLAIPFFIMVGNLMNESGITDRIFRFARALTGHWWGGLAQVNIVDRVIFAGMSGAAVADAAGFGLVEIKVMNDAGYEPKFSAAITAASSTIGPVIPPSIPFVVYGSLTNTSVAKLFMAGFIPGILMAVAMMIAVYFISKARNYPRYPKASFKEILISFKDAFFAILTPVIIIGGILTGYFTPTEASVVACFYALFLGLVVYRTIKARDLPRIIWATLLQTIRLMFIISAAGFFGWLLLHQRIPQAVVAGLTAIGTTPAAFIALVILVLLVLGCFLEGIAVFLITVPVFMPLVANYGIDPVHFGVIMTLCSMIGLLTPPVGMSLYAVSSITKLDIWEITKEMWPYLVGIFLVLLLVAYVPSITLFLPRLIG